MHCPAAALALPPSLRAFSNLVGQWMWLRGGRGCSSLWVPCSFQVFSNTGARPAGKGREWLRGEPLDPKEGSPGSQRWVVTGLPVPAGCHHCGWSLPAFGGV